MCEDMSLEFDKNAYKDTYQFYVQNVIRNVLNLGDDPRFSTIQFLVYTEPENICHFNACTQKVPRFKYKNHDDDWERRKFHYFYDAKMVEINNSIPFTAAFCKH